MKFMFLILASTLSLQSFAAIDSKSNQQEYKFKFNLKGSTYEYKQSSSSWEKAFELAAKACYQHFKSGQKLSEEQGLDIIDVCANPRS